MPSIAVKVSKQLSARVTRLAKQQKVTVSAIVRQALESLPEGSEQTIVGRFGHLFGVGSRGPRDLSTNPKHFKGYGK
jgi:hypothetical protein